MDLFAKQLPMRFTCPYCGGLSHAIDIPEATSTVQNADAVGLAVEVLRKIVYDCPTISAPATRHALGVIAAELASTRAAMLANDKRLAQLQLELMRNFENTKREIKKLNSKQEKKENTSATRPTIARA